MSSVLRRSRRRRNVSAALRACRRRRRRSVTCDGVRLFLLSCLDGLTTRQTSRSTVTHRQTLLSTTFLQESWLMSWTLTCFLHCSHTPFNVSFNQRHLCTYHHNRFTALFPGPPGAAGARIELLDFMVQGKINRGRHTDHPAGRQSIRTNQCPPTQSPFFTGRMPFLPSNQQCQSTEGK